MRNISSLLFVLLFSIGAFAQDKKEINTILDSWHLAASKADFDTYFGYMTDDSVFIGTDATENWQNKDFKAFSKPYFDKGKAWSFTAIERNIYVNGELAWFDELLDTQMKICRGSGVLAKINGQWKIKHYVLSIAVPNDKVDELIKLKSKFDDSLIQHLNSKHER